MIESLTPSEAAVVAGVSVRDVHRMIDEHILPEALYTATQTRSFKSQACALISFYFRAANRLTSEERQRTITRASESNPEPQTIRDEFLTIDLTRSTRKWGNGWSVFRQPRRSWFRTPRS
jgi:hypothetical protein